MRKVNLLFSAILIVILATAVFFSFSGCGATLGDDYTNLGRNFTAYNEDDFVNGYVTTNS